MNNPNPPINPDPAADPNPPADAAIATRERDTEPTVNQTYNDIANAGERRCFQKHNGDATTQCIRAAGHSGEHVFDVGGEQIRTV